MASLFDIGKSGLTAYRQALSVTGQNIANIDTDGYKRREASLEEVTSGKGSPTSMQNQTGIGVRVADVRRSFDEFLLNKARTATAGAESAESFYTNTKRLEDLLLPGDANLGNAIGRFFTGLQEIVTSPADVAPRVVALEQGRMMADNFNEVATLVEDMKAGIVTQTNQQIDAVNIVAAELANVNRQIAATGRSRPNNALLDSRDAMIDRISEYVGLTVELDSVGVAKLTLGSSGRGPVLVDGETATKIGVNPLDKSLSFIMSPGAANLVTSQVTKGSLNGLAEAYATTAGVMAEIDTLAFRLVRDMNALHVGGLDLEGQLGKPLFQDIDVNLSANPTNVGDVVAEVEITAAANLTTDIVTFTYDAEANRWNGRAPDGSLVASGRNSATLPGMTIKFIGAPENFDQFIIDPIKGTAAGVAMAITRPQDFAAASPLLVSADARNASDAQIEARSAPTASDAGLPPVDALFTNGASAITATSFLSGGPVAIIPANMSSIDLFSLARQSSAQFGLSDSDMRTAASLKLSVTTQDAQGNDVIREITFTLDRTQFSDESATWSDMEQIATLLNQGGITGTVSGTGDVVSLADLGGFASGASGNLTLSLSGGEINSAEVGLNTGRQAVGVVASRIDDASDIQIFTREGRHVAGSVPTPERLSRWNEAIATLPAFNDGAEYRGEYLNLSGEEGYLGLTVERSLGASEVLLETDIGLQSSEIRFDALDGLDTDELSPDGLSVSAETLSYSASFGDLTASITGADIQTVTGEGVATAMIAALRKHAPVANLQGLVSLKEPYSFTLDDVNLTMAEIHEAGAVTASYQGALYRFESDGATIAVTGGPVLATDLSFDAATQTVSGKMKTLPEDGDSVQIAFEGQTYTLTMQGGEVVVSGGEPGRLQAQFDADLRLRIVSNAGTVSKSAITILSNIELTGNKDAAQRFGLMQNDDAPETYFSNQPWIGLGFGNGGDAADGGEILQIDLVGNGAGTDDDLSFFTAALTAGDTSEIMQAAKDAFDALADKKGYTATITNNVLWFTRADGTNFNLEVTEAGVVGNTNISLYANLWPDNIAALQSGVATTPTEIGSAYIAKDFTLIRQGDRIIANAADATDPPAVSGTAKSLVGERITLSDLPDEELIVIVGSSGAKRLAMQYDLLPPDAPKLQPDISIRVTDADAGTVEFIDTATGTSMATRTLDDTGSIAALNIAAQLVGTVALDDEFHIASNADGIGDARAMRALVDLQSAENRSDGRGGFQRLFSATVAKLGATVQSGELAVEATAALRDASIEAEASFSGVNLDTEASNLIEQQQAYQASARILSTARELFNTLLETL